MWSGILEGLRKLYNYCQDIERTSNAGLLRIHYLFYITNNLEGEKVQYGQNEPWKNLKSKHGTTHSSCKNKAICIVQYKIMDGHQILLNNLSNLKNLRVKSIQLHVHFDT